MPKETFYFDPQHKRVPAEQASYFITVITNEAGKVVREQVGFPEKRDKASSLVDAMTVLTRGERGYSWQK